MTDFVRFFQTSEHVVVLTLNRPGRSNALSRELLECFSRHLDEIRADSKLRIVLLKAAGKNFCGGLDLREAASSDENAQKMPALVAGVLVKLRTMPQIVVTVAQGAARAGGGAIVAASDLVTAAGDFNIAFPEVRRGLEPMLLFPLLRRKLSASALSELLLTGEPADACRARQLGLVHHIGVDENAIVETILRADSNAVRTAKELILVQETMAAGCSLEDEFARSLKNHFASWFSPSGREGVAAFLEKREPKFE